MLAVVMPRGVRLILMGDSLLTPTRILQGFPINFGRPLEESLVLRTSLCRVGIGRSGFRKVESWAFFSAVDGSGLV